jgi:hypothetical protein
LRNKFFFDLNKLKTTPIRKVSNENIRSPENQKYRFSGIPSRKKYLDVIYPPPWVSTSQSPFSNITYLYSLAYYPGNA